MPEHNLPPTRNLTTRPRRRPNGTAWETPSSPQPHQPPSVPGHSIVECAVYEGGQRVASHGSLAETYQSWTSRPTRWRGSVFTAPTRRS
jgi:hypothetical protein